MLLLFAAETTESVMIPSFCFCVQWNTHSTEATFHRGNKEKENQKENGSAWLAGPLRGPDAPSSALLFVYAHNFHGQLREHNTSSTFKAPGTFVHSTPTTNLRETGRPTDPYDPFAKVTLPAKSGRFRYTQERAYGRDVLPVLETPFNNFSHRPGAASWQK